jgi:nitric oxide reductase subunit B
MQSTEKRPLMIASGWIQAAVIVLIIGFFIIGLLTYYTYTEEPPIPDVVKSTTGSTLFSPARILWRARRSFWATA